MSRQKVLVIDCCYSGAFGRNYVHRAGDKEVHTSEYLKGGGTFVITASDAMQYSFEDNILNKEKVMPSVFTNSLVEALNSGLADHDNDGFISPEEALSLRLRAGSLRRRTTFKRHKDGLLM